MQRLIFLLSFTLLFFLPLISAAPNGGTFLGGWRLIKDLTNPHLIEIAEFAVAQHNSLAHTKLKFEKLLKAERKTVEGLDYRVRISALDGTAKGEYVAVVWERVWSKTMQRAIIFLSLTLLLVPLVAITIQAVNPLAKGVWELIKKIKDPQLVEIACFAVAEHNLQAHTNLQFEKVLEAKRQVMWEVVSYMEKIQAFDEAVSQQYVVVVYVTGKMKQLKAFVKI